LVKLLLGEDRFYTVDLILPL